MKHTMKKLLCMALAIMLLISAVPVFAAAEGNASYSVYIDGKPGPTGTIDLTPAIATGLDALRVVNPDYVLSHNFTGFYVNEVSYPGDAPDHITNGCRLRFELETKPAEQCTVHLLLDGVDRSFQVDKGSSQRLDTALVRSLNFNIPGGYIVKQFTLADGSRMFSEGSSVVVDYNMTLNVVLAPDSSSGGNGGGTGDDTGDTNPGATTYKVKFHDVNGSCHWNIDVASGSTVGIADNSTATQISYAEANVGTKSGFTFSGWQKNGTGDVLSTATVADLAITANTDFRPVFTANSSSSGSGSSGTTTTNKFPYPVYLNIYKDTMVGSPDKRVEITKGIALDGLVTLSEVKTVVKNYYTAKDSDGITYDGLYLAKGNWVADYVADTAKYDEINAKDMTQYETVYINVMIGNAKSKSSSTADTSNPKTGDTIFVPVMVMGVTATALAAAYVFGKKRIAR